MTCIFCNKENEAKSIEHIVPESFGNIRYVIQKAKVCDGCNNKFSKFEEKALKNSIFVFERARFGIKTKKGKNAKGEVKDLAIEGNKDFKEQHINVTGLTKENLIDFNPQTQTGYLIVDSFDKSEVATSKLLLKIALESIYTSQRNIYKKYDFSELKNFLTGKENTDWPFLTTNTELISFKSVPKYTDKYVLKQNHCELRFVEFNKDTLLFKFKFGAIPMTINLLNRKLDWIYDTLQNDEKARLYPIHYRAKIEKIKTQESQPIELHDSSL